jgi:cell division protein FtsN
VSRVTKEGQVLYRVRVGKFATQEEAVAAMSRFRHDGRFPQAYAVSE